MITEEIRKFVEEECKKPTSKYGYEPFPIHFTSVVKYSLLLAEKLNADKEILEISAWLHDFGSTIYGRENHHITGAEIAEKKLREIGYPISKIEEVKHCILAHRGSEEIERKTKEAEILAEADAMAHFDELSGIFKAAFLYEHLDQIEAKNSVLKKLINSYKKLSSKAKEIIKPKFDAAILLLS